MIQYLYFHTGKEYVSKLSIGRYDEGYSDSENLFEMLRKATEGNTFTFAPIGSGEAIFMQTSMGSNGLFAKGLRGRLDSVHDAPAKYIGKFEKSTSTTYINADKLPDGELPPIGRLVEDCSIARELHHIFPQLIDALLFGDANKKIVILAETPIKAMNYIKVLSMLLPLSYMKQIGFCMGTSNIPDNDISIMKNDGSTESLSIRIWLPETTNYNFDSLASYYYVFDTKTQQDNYTKELSITAKVINEMNLCDQAQVNRFINYTARAFDALGRLNVSVLKRISALCMFEIKKDTDSAKEILDMGFAGGEAEEDAFTQAAQILLSPENNYHLSRQNKNAIVSGYRNNSRIAQSLENHLFNYYSSTYSSLDPDERNLFAEMVCNDLSGKRLDSFLKRSLQGDFKARVDAFEFAGSILDVALKHSGNNIDAIKDLIRTIVNFFNIGDCFRIIPSGQMTTGEEFFDRVLKYKDNYLQQLMVASLVASAYMKSVPEDHCEQRLRGFKKILPQISNNHIDQLEFILAVRNIILEIADMFPDLNIENQFNFLFNIRFGEVWASEFIRDLNMEETLAADKLVKSRAMQRMYYESMSTAIREKLLDINYVRKYIKSSTNATNQYKEFFNTLPEGEKAAAAEIEKLIGELAHESDINNEFAKYRYDFAYECYATLSPENQRQIQTDATPIKSYEETTDMDKKLGIVESTIQVFGTIKKHKRKGRLPYSGIFIGAFVLSLISMLILSLPAIIIPASLGTFDATHILEKFTYYFKPYLFALPVYVFILELVGYFSFKHGKRLKRANIIAILCGILPVVMFTLSCILFYFIRIDLPFSL